MTFDLDYDYFEVITVKTVFDYHLPWQFLLVFYVKYVTFALWSLTSLLFPSSSTLCFPTGSNTCLHCCGSFSLFPVVSSLHLSSSGQRDPFWAKGFCLAVSDSVHILNTNTAGSLQGQHPCFKVWQKRAVFLPKHTLCSPDSGFPLHSLHMLSQACG